MDINEAIEHARQIAEQQGCAAGTKDCAYQHDQLADWLEELVAYKATGYAPEYIKEIMTTLDDRFRLLLGKEYGIAPKRVLDILVAEKEGRLVVLPQDDGENTALCGVCRRNGEICNIEVKAVGDFKKMLSLFSYMTHSLAEKLDTSYTALLVAMLKNPSVVEIASAEAAVERLKGEGDHGQV